MGVDFEKLLKLQDSDRRVRQLGRECTDIPARKEDIESRLSNHKAALQAAEEDLKKHGLKVKELEGEIEGQKQTIAKYRDQQLKVKNNDEYRALENEVATAESKIRGLEDLEIEHMEDMEQLKAVVQERTKELKVEEVTVREDQVAMDARLKELEQEVQELETGRDGLKEGLDVSVVARYERILSHVGDFAIVGVNGGTCNGCHMQIPPQLIHDSRKNEKLTVCTYCGRILYSGA